MGHLLNFADLRMNSDFLLCRAVLCILLRSWLGSWLISLFGMESQNGVLTAGTRDTHRVGRTPSREDPIHRGFSEHNHVSDNVLNKGAIHRAERPPNAQDLLTRRCDCFEPEAGSRAVHPYLNGGDVDLTS
ncbi:hypothetical protein CRG98_020562 [Punica granatum]|uniref:Uncharacterized protein n=1 Tax=Punica granatum TaxID=22663 RepID=A0A2I0JUA0_PUNGR|nr:hypothetical protein CRG98_020562 [Punica granatum]